MKKYRRNVDEDLRDLERLAKSGDLSAQIRLLNYRIRTGKTTEDRLKVATILGDRAASIVVGIDPSFYRENFKFPPTTPEWASYIGAGPNVEKHLFEELNSIIFVPGDTLPRRQYQIFVDSFVELMEQLLGLMVQWVRQQSSDEQYQLLESPTYLNDHFARIKMDLDSLRNLLKRRNTAPRQCQYPSCSEVAEYYQSPNYYCCNKHLKNTAAPEYVCPLIPEVKAACSELWQSYYIAIRHLAHYQLGIRDRRVYLISDLTPTMFDRWQLEFWQALLPWTLGEDLPPQSAKIF